MRRLDGHTLILTGASTALGQSCTEKFLAAGAHVALVDREIPPSSHAHQRGFMCDPENAEQIAQVAADISAWQNQKLILVHAWAYQAATALADITPVQWRRNFAVHVEAAVQMALALVPAMQTAGWGRLLYSVSAKALKGMRDHPDFCAAQMGLVGLVRALANDLGPHGITANAICYGDDPADGFADMALFLASDGARMITGQSLQCAEALVG